MGSSGQGLAEMGIIQIPLHGLVAQESWVQIPLCHLPVRGKVSTSMSLFFFPQEKNEHNITRDPTKAFGRIKYSVSGKVLSTGPDKK